MLLFFDAQRAERFHGVSQHSLLATEEFYFQLEGDIVVKIIEELKYMTDMGYVPKTDWLTSALEQTHEAHQIIKEWTNYRPKISFVRIADGIVYELMPSDLTPARIQNAQPISYSSDDIPEDLMGRIAVLQTLEDGQYVEKVGLKYDRNTLWLEIAG